jgi:hypothetical protein
MTKNLIAVLAATMTTASMAVVDITGNYEGTFTDGNPGAASYAQDLDLTLVGTSGASTVTVMMEDLTGGTAVTANQVFVETTIEGIALKAGEYKTQNGSGLMQTDSDITSQFEVSTSLAGASITLGQVSEASKVTVDASLEVAGLNVTVQNATATDRFITVVTNFLGLGVTAETQNTTVGRNTAVSATTTVGGLNATTVVIDVNDATAMSQDDGILGDISTAVNGKKVVGGVLSTATTIGTVTGKAFEMNDAMTYTGEIERGALTVGYTKADNTEGVTSAEINVAF